MFFIFMEYYPVRGKVAFIGLKLFGLACQKIMQAPIYFLRNMRRRRGEEVLNGRMDRNHLNLCCRFLFLANIEVYVFVVYDAKQLAAAWNWLDEGGFIWT